MARLKPLSRYHPSAHLADHFLVMPEPEPAGESRIPLLSVLIPIQAPGQTSLLAVAELIQDGSGIAQELAALDRHLTLQAAGLFAVGGGMVVLILGWAFHRLQAIHGRLVEQAAELRRANQELALSAKTSALGAVTAHVLHGLSSPLTGLQQFMTVHAGDSAEWRDAVRGAERMQSLIGEIVRVIGEQTDGVSYDLPLSELAQIVAAKGRSCAEAAGVSFELQFTGQGALANCHANLVLLILENLLQNAVQATPSGKAVRLAMRLADHGLECEVADEGPGLPDLVRRNLFLPCRSSKPGGSGIGLALSRELARHLGAELTLARSTEAGSVFALTLPRELLVEKQLT
jgi:signal transduction histidine kinase